MRRIGAALLVLGAAAAASGAVPKPRVTRIAVDPIPPSAVGQHATIVEPSSVSSGLPTVSAFQVGRNFGGGAGAKGYATSANGGRSWRSGILPAVTQGSTPPGPSITASDPVVAYDAAHGRWLVASLAGANGQNVIFVSGSPDGIAWEPPRSPRSRRLRRASTSSGSLATTAPPARSAVTATSSTRRSPHGSARPSAWPFRPRPTAAAPGGRRCCCRSTMSSRPTRSAPSRSFGPMASS